MMWTLFVLDMDVTYGEDHGIPPYVYLIPMDRQRDVEHYAVMASQDFNAEENEQLNKGIIEYFEEWMGNNDVEYRRVGTLDIPYGERQVDYLADYIPREVV